ncbi:MAG: hypothetical protein QM754_10585 [Tepidisphaeraceae bacterium]
MTEFMSVVLLIAAGQALFLAGVVRSKNAAAMGIRRLLELALVITAAWAIGGFFLPTTIGRDGWVFFKHLLGYDGSFAAAGVLAAASIAGAAVLGATAERSRLTPILVYSAIMAGVVWPVLARLSMWWYAGIINGKSPLALAALGGGAAALLFAWKTGARKGKFNRDLSVNFFPGHAVPLQITGVLILATGWVFSEGPHVMLGFAAAVLAAALFGRLKFGKVDGGLTLLGAVGGLAAAVFCPPFLSGVGNLLGQGGAAAVLAGGIAGYLVPWLVVRIETVWRIDDAAGLASAHLGGGLVGLVISALTSKPGSFGGYLNGLWHDAVFAVVAIAVPAAVAFGVATFFAKKNALRTDETSEYEGLDLAELDVNAYPDFQQTMIKSHHLRQM